MTKVIAHRGFSAKYPENTLIAFEKAIEAGCDGIELDVRLTADGDIVIAHDGDINRMTNGVGEGVIESKTLAELKKYSFSGRFEETLGKTPIATLREYFELVKDHNIFTNVEIKSDYGNYYKLEKDTISMIREFGLCERITFSSFNHYSMKLCRELAPEIPCGILYGMEEFDAVKRALDVGAVYLHPYYKWLMPERVGAAKAVGLGINAWTIDSEEDIRNALDLEVDGIISNHPDRVRRILKG